MKHYFRDSTKGWKMLMQTVIIWGSINLSRLRRCHEGLGFSLLEFSCFFSCYYCGGSLSLVPFNLVTGVMSLLHQTHSAGMLLDHCLHVTTTSPGNVPSPQGRAGRSGVRARPSSCGRCGGVISSLFLTPDGPPYILTFLKAASS